MKIHNRLIVLHLNKLHSVFFSTEPMRGDDPV